jgi:hypothetical protein
VTTGNLTNGQVLPSYLPDANISVLLDPANPGNITFVGATNETDPAAAAAAPNTNAAATLFADIPVIGHPDILMNVVDKVLVPPEAAFNATVEALFVSDLEELAAEQEGDDAEDPADADSEGDDGGAPADADSDGV